MQLLAVLGVSQRVLVSKDTKFAGIIDFLYHFLADCSVEVGPLFNVLGKRQSNVFSFDLLLNSTFDLTNVSGVSNVPQGLVDLIRSSCCFLYSLKLILDFSISSGFLEE